AAGVRTTASGDALGAAFRRRLRASLARPIAGQLQQQARPTRRVLHREDLAKWLLLERLAHLAAARQLRECRLGVVDEPVQLWLIRSGQRLIAGDGEMLELHVGRVVALDFQSEHLLVELPRR